MTGTATNDARAELLERMRREALERRSAGPALFINAFRFDQLFHQADLIVGIEDRKIAFEPSKLGVASEHLCGDRVKCSEPGQAARARAEQMLNAFAHFARGFVGEGNGKNAPRLGCAG